MKLIKLPRNLFAMVDDGDFNYLNQWRWNVHVTKHTSYAKRIEYFKGGKKNIVYMHRLILGLNGKKTLCDHKDGNGLNNQRNNLRECNTQQNNSNRRVMKNKKTSKYLGVYYVPNRRKYISKITHNGSSIHIGYYHSEEDAAVAYNKKARELHNNFANLNCIQQNLNA